MASGPCGHVYCHGCLVEAVKAQVGGRRVACPLITWLDSAGAARRPALQSVCTVLHPLWAASPGSRMPLTCCLTHRLQLLQKKCPTCRKSMQVRQIHKVFVNFS